MDEVTQPVIPALGAAAANSKQAPQPGKILSKEEMEKRAAELAEAAAAEAEKMQELSDIEIKGGEYQVQVHIIEARDLKAENLDGGFEDSIC